MAIPDEETMARIEHIASGVEHCSTAYRLLVSIAGHAGAINDRGFGRFFAFVQHHAAPVSCIELCKLFEKERRHPLHSIPALLHHLRDVPAPPNTKEAILSTSWMPRSIKKAAERSDVSDPGSLIDATEKILHRPGIQARLDRCRRFRDKLAVHAERVSSPPKIEWNDLDYPIQIAKAFVAGAGYIYGNHVYGSDKLPYIDHNAGKVKKSLMRLLVKSSVIPK